MADFEPIAIIGSGCILPRIHVPLKNFGMQ